jgi:lysophospholipase L1-like esterase
MARVRWRLGCVAVLAATLAGGGSARAQDEPVREDAFTWSLVSRFAGYDHEHAAGAGELVGVPAGTSARLLDHPVLVDPSREVCAAGAGATWNLDGEAFAPDTSTTRERRGTTDPGCPFIVNLDESKPTHELTVTVGGRGLPPQTIEVADRLVVALGDSVGSGEGNPVQGGGARWLDTPCHRSAAAGFEQAARLVAESTPKDRSVTFVSLACSGATVPRLLDRGYRGIEPAADGSSDPPQVDSLDAIQGIRGVDAVLVSVGANDVFFGDVVNHCILRSRCDQAKFPLTPADDTADEAVGTALDELALRYDALGQRLARLPATVLASEYFDPTRNSNGDTCSPLNGGLKRVSKAEMEWAFDAVLTPLNAELKAAANRHGWRYVGGIARDFERHGYCAAGPDRWVRRLTESAATQAGAGRLSGTLHPNERGHAAIADRVAPALGDALGIAVRAKAQPADPGFWRAENIALLALGAVLGLAAIALLVVLVVTTDLGWAAVAAWIALLIWLPVLALLVVGAFLWGWLKRFVRVLRRSGHGDPLGNTAAIPDLSGVRLPPELAGFWRRFWALFGVAIVSVGFVTFVGAIVVWVRFWAARIPPFEALSAVDPDTILATGAEALIGFGVFALLAVLVVWLFDAHGNNVRSTRRGLVVLVVAELVVALVVEAVPLRLALTLLAGFTYGVVLLSFLLDRALALTPLIGNASWKAELRNRLRLLFNRPPDAPGEPDEPEWGAPAPVRWALRLIPFGLLALALVFAVETRNEIDRLLFIPACILLAALAFVGPTGIAARATGRGARSLEPARIALAVTAVACLAIILVREEAWLAVTTVIAVALAGACLFVAAVSNNDRFAPYALAVLVSVPIFGALMEVTRAISSPVGQPVAAITADGSQVVCGIFVGEQGGRFLLARVELPELGTRRRPRARLGRLTSVPAGDAASVAVGPMQPISRAQDQAVVLATELVRERDHTPPFSDPPTSCAAEEVKRRPAGSVQRGIAEKVQPELVVHRSDGFWPVPVRTLFAMQDRRRRACRRLASDLCIRLRTQGALAWDGGQGESLEYPAADNQPDDQHAVMVDALGSVDPARSSAEYFLVTGGDDPQEPIGVQFWFFYTFNYQPGSGGGFHEGDFESVGVLLSATTHRPRYVWMARHADEGRVFAWEEDVLEKSGDHPAIYVARGSHASYENCDRQSRPLGPGGLIDDRPACEGLRLEPGSTPLVDLSRVPWACWQGLFGHRREEGLQKVFGHHVADAPITPFRQQTFGGVTADPCQGVADPGNRDGPDEEVLPLRVSKQLRDGAGRLERLVDECSDWTRAPVRGAYLVACDQRALTEHVQSGLEKVDPRGVRIDVADPDAPVAGAVTLPAVRRSRRSRRLDDWRIVTGAATRVDVYAACQTGNRMLAASFEGVVLAPGVPVRVDDRRRGEWRLRTEAGTTIADSRPDVVVGGKDKKVRSCGGRSTSSRSLWTRVKDFKSKLLR